MRLCMRFVIVVILIFRVMDFCYASDLRTAAMGGVSIALKDPYSQLISNPARATQFESTTVYLGFGPSYYSSFSRSSSELPFIPGLGSWKKESRTDSESGYQFNIPLVFVVPFKNFAFGGKIEYFISNQSILQKRKFEGGYNDTGVYDPNEWESYDYGSSLSCNKNYVLGLMGAAKIISTSLGFQYEHLYREYVDVSESNFFYYNEADNLHNKSESFVFIYGDNYLLGAFWNFNNMELDLTAKLLTSKFYNNPFIAIQDVTQSYEMKVRSYAVNGFNFGANMGYDYNLELISIIGHEDEIYNSWSAHVKIGAGVDVFEDFTAVVEPSLDVSYRNNTWFSSLVLRSGIERWFAKKIALRMGLLMNLINYSFEVDGTGENYALFPSGTVTAGLGYKLGENWTLDYCMSGTTNHLIAFTFVF